MRRLLLVVGISLFVFAMGEWIVSAETTPQTTVQIDDFENVSDWVSLTLETAIVKVGNGAGRWADHPTNDYIRKRYTPPLDVSQTDALQLWLYSGVANNALIELVLDSDDPGNSGYDYYRYRIQVDWTGWKFFDVPLDAFIVTRQPLGWDHINHITFSADGWGHDDVPPDTLLILDEMRFVKKTISEIDTMTGHSATDFIYTYTLTLHDTLGAERDLTIEVLPTAFATTVLTPAVSVPANGSADVIVQTTIPHTTTPFTEQHAHLMIKEDGSVIDSVNLAATASLGSRTQPRLLADSADFSRMTQWTNTYSWAAEVRDEIIAAADSWESDYITDYGLTEWQLPPEGGQWTLYYICPDGTPLQYTPPNQHHCASNGETYVGGWPYDQVIYTRMFNELAAALVDLGLAYQLTGEAGYAADSADILLALAAQYENYPYHNRFDTAAPNGGRTHAQTLDEAEWGYKIAWGYDLIATTLTDEQRRAVENDLLRPLVTTILRNDTGISNWQSWHNLAIGAVGFAIDEPAFIADALDDPHNGFYFQLANGATNDGFWHEGAWGYHLYALRPLQLLAEMALRADIDLYQTPSLHAMFAVPTLAIQPDNRLPAFNDSRIDAGLSGRAYLYEGAYRQYGDERFADHIDPDQRGREGLLWGAATVPDAATTPQESVLLADAGLAIIRNHARAPLYLALDFGEHGGWHGHYDKLSYVLFANGDLYGVDPGTVSYAAASHTSWDVASVAHNTIVVDEQNQSTATGNLLTFHALPNLALISADAGQAYTHTTIQRTMVVNDDYILDDVRVNSDQPRQVDWVHHAYGQHAATTLTTTPYNAFPDDVDGYRHFANAQAAVSATDWQAQIMSEQATEYGSTWANKTGITATYTVGHHAGVMQYDFGETTGGYVLFSSENAPAVEEIPVGLRLDLYGDGSGNSLTVRVYDATQERFAFPIGAIDWTGWRTITATGISGWASYLGNDDDLFDVPAMQTAAEIHHNGVASGTLLVDNITLLYGTAGEQVVAAFDTSGLNVRGLGGEMTTVVLGDGLTPERHGRLPFVMQRRTAQTTTFTTLLEPITDSVRVQQAITLPTTGLIAIQTTTDLYTDTLFAALDGGTPNSFGAAQCDGALCLIRRGADGTLQRLVLADGTVLDGEVGGLISTDTPVHLQIDYTLSALNISTSTELTAPLSIYAPNIMTVTVNGTPTSFVRDGETIVLNSGVPLVVGVRSAEILTHTLLYPIFLIGFISTLAMIHQRRKRSVP